MKSKSYWASVGVILAVGLAMRVALQIKLQHFADDSYIFMRYVQNFSAGHGLVYNIGDKVIGFTSPLFVLSICAVHAVLRGLPLPIVVTVFNTLLFAALVLTAAVPRERFAGSLVLPLLLAFYFPYMDGSMNGMETMLFVAGLFGAVVALTRGRTGLALVLASLTSLTRPEGVLFLGIVIVALLWMRPARVPWRGMVISAVLIGAWVAVSLSYYGTVLPHSMLAKTTARASSISLQTRSPLDAYAQLALGFSTDSLNKIPDEGRDVLQILSVLSMPLVGLALVSYLRRRDYWAILPAFFLVVWVFYCVGKPVSIWSWYTIPTSMAFVAGLLPWLMGFLPLAGHAGRRVGLEIALALLCLGTIAYGLPKRVQGEQGMTARLFTEATYLRQTIPQAKSIMVGDIGVVGYESGLRIVDMAGLVSPEVFNKRPDGQKITFGTLVQIDHPDILLLREDPRDVDTLGDGLNRTVSFASDAEKYQFDTDYVLINVNYEYFHPFIFVKRSLATPAMFQSTAAPAPQGM